MKHTIMKSKREGFRAGGIVINDGKLLMMRVRIANNTRGQFYNIAGGSWEKGELLEETCRREIKEEFNLNIEVGELVFTVIGSNRIAFYFQCYYRGGEITLGGPEKQEHDSASDIRMYAEWVPLEKIANLPIRPKKTKDALLEYLKFSGV